MYPLIYIITPITAIRPPHPHLTPPLLSPPLISPLRNRCVAALQVSDPSVVPTIRTQLFAQLTATHTSTNQSADLLRGKHQIPLVSSSYFFSAIIFLYFLTCIVLDVLVIYVSFILITIFHLSILLYALILTTHFSYQSTAYLILFSFLP